MNREIKFRIWDKQFNKFLYQLPEKHHLDWERFDAQQFTGLTDKSGKEIYEGDIVKCPITGRAEHYLLFEAGEKDYVIRKVSIPEVYQEGLPELLLSCQPHATH